VPYHEYECTECRRVFSLMVGVHIVNRRGLRCPICGSSQLDMLNETSPREDQELVELKRGPRSFLVN
jgi:putative FmdB family regulatory protein